MKIKYKKSRLKFYLIMIILWIALGILNILFNDFDDWNSYVLLGISFMYIIMYSLNYFNQYLTIDNDIIKENHPFGKKIKMTELKNIKKYAGDYILKTEKTKLTINTQIIDKKSLEELNLILNRQNLELN